MLGNLNLDLQMTLTFKAGLSGVQSKISKGNAKYFMHLTLILRYLHTEMKFEIYSLNSQKDTHTDKETNRPQ